jgi:hypothetical protein
MVPRLNSTPLFDERFVGYGKNKIQWIQHLRLSGFEFYVVPRAFVMHCPHEVSAARNDWQQVWAKRDRQFRDFLDEKMRNATIRTTMCEISEPERARAWERMRPPTESARTASDAGLLTNR